MNVRLLTSTCQDVDPVTGSFLNASGQKKSPGFVEVKRLDFAQIHFKTSMDPVQLGTFSENALDTHDGQNVLAIQTVGTNVTVAQRM